MGSNRAYGRSDMDDVGMQTEEGKARPRSRLWRIAKWTGVALVTLLVLAWLSLVVFGSHVIKSAINGVGPTVLGVPVSVKDVTFKPLRGLVRLQGLHVGNPKGFKTSALFDLKEVRVELEPVTLFRGPLHIKSIHVKEPVITYELALGRSNIGALLESLGGKDADKGKKPVSAGGKGKVIVDELVIEGARVKLSATILQGVAAPIPLPRITLRDIGKEKGGASWFDATKSVLTAVGSAVGSAVVGIGGAVVDGVKAIGHGIGSLFSGSSSNAAATNATEPSTTAHTNAAAPPRN